MILRLGIALLLSALASGPLRAERLRVASYNLENYNLADRRTPDGFSKNAPKTERAKTALRAVIRAMNADVLAVQEIGGPAFTEELRRDLAAEGLDYPHTVTLEGPDPHRRLAILSKRPFVAVHRHARVETGFALPSPGEDRALMNRGLLGVSLDFDGRTWRIVTAHLKSRITRDKADPRGEGERRAEIAAALAKLGPTETAPPTLLLGDFNDGPNSAVVTAITRAGFRRLRAEDTRGDTWTYRNDAKGFYDHADHAFVSASAPERTVVARLPEHPLARLASDHRPVIVELFSAQDSRIAPKPAP